MTHKPVAASWHARACAESVSAEHAVRTGEVASPCRPAEYESPVLVDLGHIREVTLGSSPNGNADANAQYYW
ncbi:lasso RiPP family leader peptide-containing protein [Streptomyces sp. NPDC048481]|uniref:lasso RiPP family leader peptide-containing protein n=1 Tax=Streptomyces sp. NPDC048481 TaxID=3365557 RepID=UPI00371B9D36